MTGDGADGRQGFVINGISATDESGFSVSSAGDINGDGVDDLLIGAPQGDSNGNSDAGESYVVFGRRTHDENGDLVNSFGTEVHLSQLNGSNGFAINGIHQGSWSGLAVSSAGNINGDQYDDLIIGAPYAAPNGTYSGQSYVIYGQASYEHGTLDLVTMLGLDVRIYAAEGSTDAIYTANAVDTESDEAVIAYSLGDTQDEASFNIDSETGAVTFKEAPDYENPQDANSRNDYIIDVIANSANDTTTSQTVTVTVINVNEAPVFDDGSTDPVEVLENVMGSVYTAAATDEDGDRITYSLGDTKDEAHFNIDARTGVVTFQKVLTMRTRWIAKSRKMAQSSTLQKTTSMLSISLPAAMERKQPRNLW